MENLFSTSHSFCLFVCLPPQVGCVHSVTSVERRRWCVNTGSEDCARRETSASSSMSTTWPRCLNATSTPSLVCWFAVWQMSLDDCILLHVRSLLMSCVCVGLSQVSVATRNVHFCTLTPSPKSKTAPGTTEASANTVGSALWWAIWTQYQTYSFCLLWSFFHPPLSGPDCRHRHTRRVICMNYLVGFCPEGKSCKFMQYVLLFIHFLLNGDCLSGWATSLSQFRLNYVTIQPTLMWI